MDGQAELSVPVSKEGGEEEEGLIFVLIVVLDSWMQLL
jgi:hypothetical protein